MILLKRFLKPSINKRWLLAALLALASGCGPGNRAGVHTVVPLNGYADLSRLAPLNPAWKQVKAIDAALARLHGVPDAPGVQPAEAATLPAMGIQAPAIPAPPLTRRRGRLNGIVLTQVQRFRQRRSAARRLEVNRRRQLSEQQARQVYEAAARTIQTEYAARFANAGRAEAAQETNLRLREAALLTQERAFTLAQSAPILVQIRRDLAAVRAQLAQLDQARSRAVQAAQATRDASFQQAAETRTASVNEETARAEARLLAEDERLAQLEKDRLRAVIASLPPPRYGIPVVPTAGTVATITLPLPSAAPAPQTAWELDQSAAVARLTVQRARWIALITDDTRVAAQDAARARKWTLRFSGTPSHGAGRDLTGALAEALQTGVWKTQSDLPQRQVQRRAENGL